MLVGALQTLAFPGFLALVAGVPRNEVVDAFDTDAQFDKMNAHAKDFTPVRGGYIAACWKHWLRGSPVLTSSPSRSFEYVPAFGASLFPSRRFIASLSTLAFLASCSAGTINYVHVDSSYDPTVMAHIPYTGPLFAEVSGNPFGIPQADLQRLVNDIIQPPGAKAEIGQGTRVHFAFGPSAADRHSACSMGGNNTMSSTISVVAAMCRGSDGATTYLVGSVDDIKARATPGSRASCARSPASCSPGSTPTATRLASCRVASGSAC